MRWGTYLVQYLFSEVHVLKVSSKNLIIHYVYIINMHHQCKILNSCDKKMHHHPFFRDLFSPLGLYVVIIEKVHHSSVIISYAKMASQELQSKVNQLTSKLEVDVSSMVDEIERLKLRPLARNMHSCIVSCYDKWVSLNDYYVAKFNDCVGVWIFFLTHLMFIRMAP